ncbi:SHOCT domain-containing protein [Clostridium sp. ZS1]|uniref:SHOCT domain-containing protein n=1 Tax=Clostridium sp. ZS1 TaxID=2949989 RepID=UPI0020795BB5|nr:SHOCT domain-containing protein [Clostridium sp. ZS1]
MRFFSLKAICSICNKEIGLNRYKIANNEWICPECLKKCGVFHTAKPVLKMTAEEIKDAISINQAKKEELELFNATKKIGSYIEFDDNQKKWLMPDGLFGKRKNPKIYEYSDIVDFELLEDGESIFKGDLGRAITGGVLFGGTGAIVGGITGGEKSEAICTNLKIKITIKNINNPTLYINFITTATKKSSSTYKMEFNLAQECLSVLQLITNNQEVLKEVDTTFIGSSTDEILKFKNLLDNGVITQEEFDAKKKQLLGL